MTTELVIALVAVALLLADRWLQRRRELEWIGLVDRLCQRVQAPHAAVQEHHEQAIPDRGGEYAPPAVPPDDDEAYWASRDKLAELLMEQETSGRS